MIRPPRKDDTIAWEHAQLKHTTLCTLSSGSTASHKFRRARRSVDAEHNGARLRHSRLAT
eukprot:9417155-Pyramimonas_sp.AAC.1